MREVLIAYMYFFNKFIAFYLVIYISYLLLSSVFGAILVLRKQRMNHLHNILEHDYYYPISIIVPMFNEGQGGIDCVNNLVDLDFKLFEIIIVDDGSTDNTKQLAINTFNLKRDFTRPIQIKVPCRPINEIYTGVYRGRSITLISKENGGCKADATNAGINASRYAYILCMDGDEILQKDSLKHASRVLLEDDKTIAVGGNIKISNSVEFNKGMPEKVNYGENLLVDVQTLEYSRGFIGARIFQNLINANLIISGGFGIFKKQAVIDVGGYDTDSLGEDMELTTKLHKYYRKNKIPYSMKFAPESICWTQAPADIADFRKQRQRWHMGLRQTIAEYKGMILNPRYGFIGMFMLPFYIFYELLYPVVMLLGVFAIGIGIYFNLIDTSMALNYYLLYVLFNTFLGSVAYIGNYLVEESKIDWAEVVYFFLVGIADAFLFRTLLTLFNFAALFKRRKNLKWNSPKRVINRLK